MSLITKNNTNIQSEKGDKNNYNVLNIKLKTYYLIYD